MFEPTYSQQWLTVDLRRLSLKADSLLTPVRRLAPGQVYGTGMSPLTPIPTQIWLTVFHYNATDKSDATPSFALMDVQGPVIVTYVYQLVEGEVSAVADSIQLRQSETWRALTLGQSR